MPEARREVPLQQNSRDDLQILHIHAHISAYIPRRSVHRACPQICLRSPPQSYPVNPEQSTHANADETH